MFIDTSAIVAILCAEPEAHALAEKIETASIRWTSPMVRLEACMVLAARLDCDPREAEALFDTFLDEAEVSVMPITDEMARIAVDAFRRFGKGRGSAAQLNLAGPSAGDGFELDAIAAVFIGGAAVTGGIGTVGGAIVGGLIIGILNNGMTILGVGTEWQEFIKGLVLLGAVAFDVFNKRRAARSGS